MGIYDQKPWLKLYDADVPHHNAPRFESALDMFRDAVRRAPDRPLLHYFDRTFTVAEVDRLSDALALGFQELGFRPGDRVAAYLQNVPQFVLTMLAAWKAGGILVSLNPMLRHKEVATILEDSGARLLVALESLYHDVAREVVPKTAVEAVVTTSELDFLETVPPSLRQSQRKPGSETTDLVELIGRHEGRRPEPVSLRAQDVAFLTYTSGTTGPPKGAMNTHANVVFNSQTYRDWMKLGESDVILGVAPLFHITGLIGHITLSMLIPAPLVLYYRFDPGLTAEMIERHRCTFTIGSITVFIALMNSEEVRKRDLSSLKKVYSGGAPIAPPTVDAFRKQFGPYIHNIYGLTEATGPSHAVPLDREAPVDPTSGALSVGVPIFDTDVRVVDDQGNDVAPGELGEIVMSGPLVVAGYWQKPEETQHAMPGGVLHTGDIGFMDEQGWFYIVDRKKDMIIASGYKVWPREVEDVLYAHPAVREVAVVGVPHPYRGETVKAFVSLREGQSADPDELIAFCKERMAAYKRPTEIAVLDDLPKTASGKILRRELRNR